VRFLADGGQGMILVIAHPADIPVEEPRCLISSADPSLNLAWSQAQRFCCEQLEIEHLPTGKKLPAGTGSKQ
jgi:hypothetical protein